jgi:F-type H+-transporting ATPase subunit b
MKISGSRRKRRLAKIRTGMICCMAALLFFCIGTALASSGGEGGESHVKHWEVTDTARVMNFTVLVVALFFLLRKPLSKALSARIEGIKNQLSELEEQKKAAEKELAEFNEKIALLEKEAEKIIEEYIKQGNETKARILVEAASAAEKLEEQARRNIENEFKRAKLQLQREITEKAIEKAEALIKSKITSEDQDKLVEEYLNKVVA